MDIGGSEHWVAISPERDEGPVRCDGTFTADLNSMAQWLLEKGVRRVAMQSTLHNVGIVEQQLAAQRVQLGNVLSDLSGASGMAIVTAILDGERDPTS